jgi:hypothetical protein
MAIRQNPFYKNKGDLALVQPNKEFSHNTTTMEAVQIFGPVTDTKEEMKRLQEAINTWLKTQDGVVDIIDRKFGYSHDKITAAVYYRKKGI